MLFPLLIEPIPSLTRAQMIEVDRAMIEDYHIDLIQMMENAGRSLAYLARVRFLEDNPRGKKVIILAGSGGNGGGALVCARRLHTWGAQVQVFLTRPSAEFTPIPSHQLDILQRMAVPVLSANELDRAIAADLVVDGIIGYSLQGAPRGAAAALIRWANAQPAPVLALDVPSGLDTTQGAAHDPTIQAVATLTLALPKAGLLAQQAARYVGELYLADIGVPPELYAGLSLQLQVGPIFSVSEILRLR